MLPLSLRTSEAAVQVRELVMTTSRGLRRRAMALLIAALLPSLLVAPAVADHAGAHFLDAQTPVDAALEWSQFTYADGSAAHAVLGRDDVFADNLASGLMQGVLKAPLLLTAPHRLDPDVTAELKRLGARTVHVLGGEKAMSPAITDELKRQGFVVRRLAGGSRIETAVALAKQHASNPTAAILARAFSDGTDESRGFADSLAAGAWAAEEAYPVLLTPTGELPASVADYLRSSTITRVFIVGGSAAIGPEIEAELAAMGYQVTRISGVSRVETALAIATERRIPSARQAERIVVVEGQSPIAWAGGFAAAGYAANRGAVVLSTDGSLPEATRAFLEGGSAPLVCAPFLTSEICDAAADELGHDPASNPLPSNGVTIAPSERTLQVVSSSGSGASATSGVREYTATVAPGVSSVNIALLPSGNVKITGGAVTFTEGPTGQAAALGQTVGAITHVNEVDVTDSRIQANIAVPESREVTFTLNAFGSLEAGDVTPVVYEPVSSSDPALPTAGGAPTRVYGVAGSLRWLPLHGANATTSLGKVVEVDKARKFLITGTGEAARIYYWDANDTFRINSEAVSMLAFEQRLAPAERLSRSNYQQDATKVSVFDITTNYPTPPDVSTRTPGADATVRVSVTPGQPTFQAMATGDKFRILRAARTAGSTCDAAATYATTWTTVAERTKSQDAINGEPFEFNDTNVPGGCWRYAAQVIAGPDVSEVSDTYGYAQIGTISTNSTMTPRAGTDGLLASGDAFQFNFDKAMIVSAGTVFNLVDADGTKGTVTCGTNATCSPAVQSGLAVTVTMTGPPVISVVGGTAGLGYQSPSFLAVTGVSGAPNALQVWNLAESGRLLSGRSRIVMTSPNSNRNTVLGTVPGGMAVASGTSGLIIVAGSDEVWTISPPVRTDGSLVNGGDYTLRVGADTATASLPISATATQIRDAFTAVYGHQVVNVSGGPLSTAAIRVEFTGGLAGQNLDPLVVDSSTLTPMPDTLTVTETQPGVPLVDLAVGDVLHVFDLHGLPIATPRTITLSPTLNGNSITLNRALAAGEEIIVLAIKTNGVPSRSVRLTAA